MSNEPQLFRVNPDDKASEPIQEVEFAALGLRERRDIQEWVAANPGILGDDLLIIGKEFSDFDRTNERLDLLAVDSDGKLVIIELKRDDTGADAHWQAIKYASYLHRASVDDIIRMMADYADISQEDAAGRLQQHLGADDLNALNKDQRIILASHRFAPEVTSAALWLNEKAPGENLITCVKLTPHRDPKTDSLYIQASTIIPVPRIDDYVVNVGGNSQHTLITAHRNFAENMRITKEQHKNDDITRFLKQVGDLTIKGLSDPLKPDKRSNHAGNGAAKGTHRHYHLWYSRPNWSNWKMTYLINLYDTSSEDVPYAWRAELGFGYKRSNDGSLSANLNGLHVYDDQEFADDSRDGLERRLFVSRCGNTLDDSFAYTLAETMMKFIEQITPVVDDLENVSE